MQTENYCSSKVVRILNQQSELFAWKVHDNYAGGVPDMFLEGPARDLWVEAKRIYPVPKKDTTIINFADGKKYLSRLQMDWLERRHKLGKNDVFLLVYTTEGWVLLTPEQFLKPMSWGELKLLLKKELQVIAQLQALLN